MTENLIKKKTTLSLFLSPATYFMTYHSIMKDNKDYITGLKEARKVADNMTNMLRLKTGGNSAKVFPYR